MLATAKRLDFRSEVLLRLADRDLVYAFDIFLGFTAAAGLLTVALGVDRKELDQQIHFMQAY
jgi:hypothetical protein